MEILILVLLYYLSQNPDFHEKLKPLASGLKNSEQMLSFLKDLSKFAEVFGNTEKPANKEQAPPPKPQENKNPQPPTAGIADDFIQKVLDGYLKK